MLADIPYTLDTGEKLVNETFGPNNIRRRSTGSQELKPMEVADGRRAGLSFEDNGFVLVPHATRMKNFFDPEELKSVYYREVEDLVARISGATLRESTSASGFDRIGSAIARQACTMAKRRASSASASPPMTSRTRCGPDHSV